MTKTLVAATAVVILAGCGVTIPADPGGSFDEMRDGVTRVGVSADPGLIEQRGTEAAGPLADVVEDFADRIHSEVRWEFGSEETLVAELESGELDIVVGGMTSASPWVERVGSTRGYTGLSGDGRELVLLVPMGENRLLSELEIFLDEAVRE